MCLVTGTLAAAALSARHLGAAALPGCGLESACDRLLASRWGALPVLGWPVAFVGASWLLALSCAWVGSRSGWSRRLAWSTRAGALASLFFVAAMLAGGEPCPYCLVVHAANLAFLVFSERAARDPAGAAAAPLQGRRAGAPAERLFALVFLAATLGLGLAWHQRGASARRRDELELERTTRALLDARDDPGREDGARGTFTGRYRLGRADAPLRLVLFSDYQCPECARIEREAQALLVSRSDLSLSAKHYPLCSDCNRLARERGQNPHPNACWAARAAEAAGIVAGEEGFWAMHRWLFERGGRFDQQELDDGLAALGLPRAELLSVLRGDETLRRVQADVEEALDLGIQMTPMIFLNGVELRGWQAPRALQRAVEALAATRPPPGTADADRPPGALEKCLEDWRVEPAVTLPPAGRPDAVREPLAVLWGDYLDPATRELDRRVRAALGERSSSLYSFRHFPLDPACDPSAPALHPGACLAARAAEAAFEVGGEASFRAMHERLMELADLPGEAALVQEARVLGLDAARFTGALTSGRTLALVRSDVASARGLGITSIPCLFVQQRRVPRWRLEGEPLVERILEEALGR